jgi:hypothetical protein
MDSDNAPSTLSVTELNEMGFLCIEFNITIDDYKRSNRESSASRSAIRALETIEARARKILKKHR